MAADFLFISSGLRFEKVFLNSIIYLEAMGNLVRIVTESRQFTTDLSIEQLQKKLPPCSFCRIHSAYLISMDKILYFDEEEVQMPGVTVPVESKYANSLKERITILNPPDHNIFPNRYFVDESGNLRTVD